MTNQTVLPQPTGAQRSWFFRLLRPILANRFSLLALAAVILGAAAYSSWGWLVALGIAPLLVSFAPCAAMCALGICAMGGKKDNRPQSGPSGLAAGPDAGLRLDLAPSDVIEGTFDDLDKPLQTKANGNKGCC